MEESQRAGEWQNDLMNGTGMLVLVSGTVIKGCFRVGRLQGNGRIEFVGGNWLESFWNSGKVQGQIMRYFAKENKWELSESPLKQRGGVIGSGEGVPKQNLIGEGTLTSSISQSTVFDKARFSQASLSQSSSTLNLCQKQGGATMNQGSRQRASPGGASASEGLGMIELKNPQRKYYGVVQGGKPNGLGATFYQNGLFDVGVYHEGSIDGVGKITHPSGSFIWGEISKGKLNGRGLVFSTETESWMSGVFKPKERKVLEQGKASLLDEGIRELSHIIKKDKGNLLSKVKSIPVAEIFSQEILKEEHLSSERPQNNSKKQTSVRDDLSALFNSIKLVEEHIELGSGSKKAKAIDGKSTENESTNAGASRHNCSAPKGSEMLSQEEKTGTARKRTDRLQNTQDNNNPKNGQNSLNKPTQAKSSESNKSTRFIAPRKKPSVPTLPLKKIESSIKNPQQNSKAETARSWKPLTSPLLSGRNKDNPQGRLAISQKLQNAPQKLPSNSGPQGGCLSQPTSCSKNKKTGSSSGTTSSKVLGYSDKNKHKKPSQLFGKRPISQDILERIQHWVTSRESLHDQQFNIFDDIRGPIEPDITIQKLTDTKQSLGSYMSDTNSKMMMQAVRDNTRIDDATKKLKERVKDKLREKIAAQCLASRNQLSSKIQENKGTKKKESAVTRNDKISSEERGRKSNNGEILLSISAISRRDEQDSFLNKEIGFGDSHKDSQTQNNSEADVSDFKFKEPELKAKSTKCEECILVESKTQKTPSKKQEETTQNPIRASPLLRNTIKRNPFVAQVYNIPNGTAKGILNSKNSFGRRPSVIQEIQNEYKASKELKDNRQKAKTENPSRQSPAKLPNKKECSSRSPKTRKTQVQVHKEWVKTPKKDRNESENMLPGTRGLNPSVIDDSIQKTLEKLETEKSLLESESMEERKESNVSESFVIVEHSGNAFRTIENSGSEGDSFWNQNHEEEKMNLDSLVHSCSDLLGKIFMRKTSTLVRNGGPQNNS